MMNEFAGYGYDVWTMDHDGYGYSGSSGNNSDIASGVEDLKAGIAVVMKETGQQKAHFFGESSGSIRAGAYAQSEPGRIDRLVLAASTYKGEGADEIARRRARIDELRATPRRKRDAGMIRSIFSRDGHPGIYDPAVTEALVATEMKFGDTIPAGTYVDMAVNLPLMDPAKITAPVLMTRGEWDGNSTNNDLLDFFRQLPNGDRQYVILPNTAHSQGFSKNRAADVVRDQELPRCAGAGCELAQVTVRRRTRAAPDTSPPALPRRDSARSAPSARRGCRSRIAARFRRPCDCGRRRRSRPTGSAPDR